jgi:hypothetical protein
MRRLVKSNFDTVVLGLCDTFPSNSDYISLMLEAVYSKKWCEEEFYDHVLETFPDSGTT